MTIIDTTLYCNGELRLAKHGPRAGGTVLMHVPSGRQVDFHPEYEQAVIEGLKWAIEAGIDAESVFASVAAYDEGFRRLRL